MAEIVISFDTKEKTGKCTVDGVEYPNMVEAMFYKYDKEWHAQITSAVKDEDNDMAKYERLIASETEKGKEELKDVVHDKSDIEGFSKVSQSSTKEKIVAFMSQRRK